MINSMKKNIITRAIAGTALLASFSSLAVVEPITMAFVTVADLQVNQTQAIAFGSSVIGAADTTCNMNVAVLAANVGNTGTIPDADIDAGLTGDGCLNVTTAPSATLAGIYNVIGIPSQAVTITVASAVGAGFTYAPRGFVVPDDSTLTFATAVTLFNDVPTSFTLGDDTTQQAQIVIGGALVIDSGAALLSNNPYSTTFDITVTY